MQVAKNITGVFFWTLIIGLSVHFFLTDVWVYFYGFRSRVFGNSLFNNQVWVIAHMFGGTLALFIGPMQFWKGLRNKYLEFHRLMGKLYILGCFLVGLSALRLSLVSFCIPCRISLFITAVLLLFSTGAAWYTVRHKNTKAHRQFMVRSYVLILAFVLVRINNVVPIEPLFGKIEDSTFSRVVKEYFFSFFPLIVAEVFLTWLPALRRGKVIKAVK